jgi:hypothetical protein
MRQAKARPTTGRNTMEKYSARIYIIKWNLSLELLIMLITQIKTIQVREQDNDSLTIMDVQVPKLGINNISIKKYS